MPTPGEHKTVQARILAYAEAIGWTVVPREEAERRSGFDAPSPGCYGGTSPEVPPADRARNRSLFFDDLLDANPPSLADCGAAWVREFNPRYAEAEGGFAWAVPPSPYRHLRQPGTKNAVPRIARRRLITA